MNILIYISLLILTTYLTGCFFVFRRVPESLSNTYYLLNEKRDQSGWLFMVTLMLTGISLAPAIIEITEGHPLQFLSFLCPASIIFVGAAPRFKDAGMESLIHPIAALISAASCVLWIILVAGMGWVLLIFLVAASLLAIATKSLLCYVFWLEMVAFGSVYTTLLIL